MSDGPHKSLPMRRHWRNLAERAAKAAFSPDQVCEALPHALMRDMLEAPIGAVRDILSGGRQGSLFADQQNALIAQLEASRAECRGSAAANTFIDGAVAAVRSGQAGDEACQSALQSALEDTTRSALRSIEEHYQREATEGSVRYVRNRMDAARRQCDLGALADALLSPGKPPRGSARLPQHTGIDEGPQL